MISDTNSIVISFLSVRDINSLRLVNKDYNKDVQKYKHIYIENKLKVLWGNSIVDKLLISNEEKYKTNIIQLYDNYKYKNFDSYKAILHLYYDYIFAGNKFNINMYSYIYEIHYNCRILDKDFLSCHIDTVKTIRLIYIKKYFKLTEINEKNHILRTVLNISKHIDTNYIDDYDRQTVLDNIRMSY